MRLTRSHLPNGISSASHEHLHGLLATSQPHHTRLQANYTASLSHLVCISAASESRLRISNAARPNIKSVHLNYFSSVPLLFLGLILAASRPQLAHPLKNIRMSFSVAENGVPRSLSTGSSTATCPGTCSAEPAVARWKGSHHASRSLSTGSSTTSCHPPRQLQAMRTTCRPSTPRAL